MARPITAKIDVTKILKEHLYEGKKGKYLNLVIWPNKNGTGEYGDTHVIRQELSREARDRGVDSPIIGNLTMPDDDAPRQPSGGGRAPQRDYKLRDGGGRESAPKRGDTEDFDF